MEKSSDRLVIANKKGEEIVCNKLFSFDSDETKLSYIVYTDNTLDDDGNLNIEVRSYDPTGKDLSLKPVTSERELKVVENILNAIPEYIEELKNSLASSGDENDGRRESK